MNKKSTISILSGLVAILAIASLVFGIPPQEALASHNGEPSMWVNGINDAIFEYDLGIFVDGKIILNVSLIYGSLGD